MRWRSHIREFAQAPSNTVRQSNNRYQFKVTQLNPMDEQDTLLDTFKIQLFIQIRLCNMIPSLLPLLNCHSRVTLNWYLLLSYSYSICHGMASNAKIAKSVISETMCISQISSLTMVHHQISDGSRVNIICTIQYCNEVCRLLHNS